MLGDKQTALVAVGLFAASIVWGRKVVKISRNKSSGNGDNSKNIETAKEKSQPEDADQTTTQRQYRHPNTAPIQLRIIHPDAYYLKHAQQIRLALDPPLQSNFRVVCILLLENGSVIVGTNDECTPNIGGAICAERAALLAYRMQFTKQFIPTIYIVTDSDTPIPPGTLCREYLYGHPATMPDTRFVLQSNDVTSTPWIVTLKELYPYPSIYSGLSAQEQVMVGRAHESYIERLLADFSIPNVVFNDQIIRLVVDAHQVALQDNRTALHPIQYGAAAIIRLYDKIEYLQASQQKALEYGSTQDAVCQLLAVIRQRERLYRNSVHECLRTDNDSSSSSRRRQSSPIQVVCIVMVDQFGIPHVPFAPARSLLVEHGLGDAQVLFTTVCDENESLMLESVAARELCPFVPDFCGEEAQKTQQQGTGRSIAQDSSRLTLIDEHLRRDTTRNVRMDSALHDSWGIVGQESLPRLDFPDSFRQ